MTIYRNPEEDFNERDEMYPSVDQRLNNQAELLVNHGARIEALGNQISELGGMLQQMLNNQNSAQVREQERLTHSQNQDIQPIHDIPVVMNGRDVTRIKLPVPEKYSGPKDSTPINTWVSVVNNYLYHYNYHNCEAGVNVVVALLKGTAATWYLHQVQVMKKTFSNPQLLLEALATWANPQYNVRHYRDKLAKLTETGDAQEYVTKFQNLCLLITDLSDAEALDKFIRGTKASTRIEIMKMANTGLTLETAISTCLLLGGIKTSYNNNNNNNHSGGAPMDLDAVNDDGRRLPLTSKQKTYLANNNGCFYCRKPNVNHRSNNCPNKKQKQSEQQHQELEVEVVESDYYSTDSERYSVEANIDNQDDFPVLTSNKKPLKNHPTKIKSVVTHPQSCSPTQSSPNPRPILLEVVDNPDNRASSNNNSKKFGKKNWVGRGISDRDDWQLNPRIAQEIFSKWGQPTVDLFASQKNRQAEFYYRKPSELPMGQGCLGENSLGVPWDYQELVYANPPWQLIDKVVDKAKRDHVKRLIVISPITNKSLRAMSIEKPIRLAHTRDLYLPPDRQGTDRGGVGLPHWKESWAFLISGDNAPVEKTCQTESRFLFNTTVNDNNCLSLLDTGCTSIVASEDFIRRNNICTYPVPSQQFRFGNKTTGTSNRGATLELRKDNYQRRIKCFIADIKQDLILGTPWFETITVTHMDWSSREIHFINKAGGGKHKWDSFDSKPKKLKQVLYSSPDELLRNTSWVAVVDIRELEGNQQLELLQTTAVSTDKSSNNSTPLASSNPEHTPIVGMYDYKKVKKKTRGSKKMMMKQAELDLILNKYQKVFSEPTEPPPDRIDNHKIDLISDSKIPPWRPIPALNLNELNALKEFIQTNLDRGYITHSRSPFGACVIFAKKKDGGLRVCIDYRGLNNITIKDRTPLPNIKEMQDRLQGASVFTKVDLREGFHNILVRNEDSYKTSFRTRYMHFEFKVVPFGLCNAPATFMRMMNRLFGQLYDTCIIAYVDDILIYSMNAEEHKVHLEQVMQILQDNNLFLKLSE